MGPLVGRRGDHQEEALLGRRELRDVVVRMGPPNVLLHGAIALLLTRGHDMSDAKHQRGGL